MDIQVGGAEFAQRPSDEIEHGNANPALGGKILNRKLKK
jgi:hypothetical protein